MQFCSWQKPIERTSSSPPARATPSTRPRPTLIHLGQTNSEPRFWDSFRKKIRSQPNWTNFGKIRMNFGLNSVNFRNVKHKIRFGPQRNRRISSKFGLIRSNLRTLPRTRTPSLQPCLHERRRWSSVAGESTPWWLPGSRCGAAPNAGRAVQA
jgi:hypothetical protein